jgi:Tol biopolymer transport system component
MRRLLVHIFLCLIGLIVLFGQALAYNRHELTWRTIDREHFRVHYHEGAERTAQMAAQIVDEIYGPITRLYDHPLDKTVDVIILDTDDYANGLTYYYQNKIEIYATQMDWELRGTHNWLRNVITHEFTHMVTLQLLWKFPGWLPAFYIQHIGYEEEKRPDVISGYPHVMTSYPLPGTVIPLWFAEGVAQFQAPGLEYDSWDTHRDMLLRMAVLGDGLLNYDQMGSLVKGGLGSEMVYNQGYSLTTYIAQQYGAEKLEDLCRAMRSPLRWTFSSAIKNVIGKSGPQLYEEWHQKMLEQYEDQKRVVEENPAAGRQVTDEGWMNHYPVWSPDSTRLAFLSNRGSTYQIMSLYLMDAETEETEVVAGGLRSAPSWSPDGQQIVYAKRIEPNKYGYHLNDIYLYDVATKEEKRLTHGLRGFDPVWSPDGKSILVVLNADGTHNLALLDAQGQLLRTLTENDDGTQYYRPRWSPDGEQILVSRFDGHHRDIVLIPSAGGEARTLIGGLEDERDACWQPDGQGIYYVSDRSGIFNIYQCDLQGNRVEQISNVVGGAFSPAPSPDGKTLAYAGYTSDGYQILLMPLEEAWERPVSMPPIVEMGHNPGYHQETPSFESHPYQSIFTTTFFLPRLMIDAKKFKGGLYVASSELLDKQNIFATLVAAADGDFDLYAQYENRMFAPTFLFEAYRLRKNVTDQVTDNIGGHPTLVRLDTRYDLTEFDVGIKYAWSEPFSVSFQKELSLTYIFSKYDVYLEAFTEEPVPGDLPSGSFLGKDSWTYFRGHDIALRWDFKSIARAPDAEINPRGGREIHFRYDRMFNKLINPNTLKKTEYGFVTVYYKNYYNQFLLDWKEYRALPWGRHTLVLSLKGGLIDEAVDDFFYLQAGSQEGLRGYSFYSIEGRRMALASLTYRLPLWRDMDFKIFHLYFDKLYGSVFFDAGKAWNEDRFDFDNLKRDVGAELRLDALSYYAFPTKVSFTAAYALDDIPAADYRPAQQGDWRFYFNLLFTFVSSNGARGAR